MKARELYFSFFCKHLILQRFTFLLENYIGARLFKKMKHAG